MHPAPMKNTRRCAQKQSVFSKACSRSGWNPALGRSTLSLMTEGVTATFQSFQQQFGAKIFYPQPDWVIFLDS